MNTQWAFVNVFLSLSLLHTDKSELRVFIGCEGSYAHTVRKGGLNPSWPLLLPITKAWDSLASTSPTTRTLPYCYEFGCGPVMESSSVSTRERVKQMVHMCTYNNILSYKRGRLHHCIMNTMDPGRWYPKQALREILPVLNIPMQSKTRST